MSMQIVEHGIRPVKLEIMFSVEKCLTGLSIDISAAELGLLIDDIIDVYKTDSVEDINECLKRGRQGHYGLGYNTRKSFTMLTFREWMSKHLEEKAAIREKELSKFKKRDDEKMEGVDYEAYKNRLKESKSEKETNAIENEYQRFRNEYLNPKPEPKQKAK